MILGDDATRDGVPQLQWMNMPESWGVFVLIAIIMAIAIVVFWLYVREIKSCPTPIKVFLAILRFVVLAMLVILFLNPSIRFVHKHSLKPTIAFARDASLSFSRRDAYQSEPLVEKVAAATQWDQQDIQAGRFSRAEILERSLVQNEGEVVQLLREKGALRIVDFSDFLDNVALIPAGGSATSESNQSSTSRRDENRGASQDTTRDGDNGALDVRNGATDRPEDRLTDALLPPLTAAGKGTDISWLLRELLNDSSRLSAIVIASDGQHNGSESDLQDLARQAQEKGIPIYTVGVGDPTRPRNIAITDVYVRDKAQPNEPFEIEVLFQLEDIQESEIAVELIEHELNAAGESASEKVVATETLNNDGQGRQRIKFQRVVRTPSMLKYTVKVQPVSGETELSDNEMRSSIVEVVDEKIKVLLVSGSPSWEFQLLQRLLQRDSMIALSCWLQTMDEDRPQEGNEPISELPRTIEELGHYNVIMLLDPDPREFDEEWVEAIQIFCRRRAGGVFYMAGRKYTSLFMTLNRLKGFRDMMPVRFGDDNFMAMAEADLDTAAVQQRTGGMMYVKHNLDHPIMSFSKDSGVNESIWGKMPSVLWNYPTFAAKPTGQVLLERGGNAGEQLSQPLLVAGRFGAGNVVFMSFNGTWRWRSLGVQAEYFDRFWIQLVRFLVETRSLQGSRRGVIDTDRTEYELGNRVTLIAQIDDEQFQPLNAPSVPAVIRGDDGNVQTLELKATPGQIGSFEATYVAQQIGNFQVFVNLPGVDDDSGIESINFRVDAPSIELQSYWLDEKLLREIAELSGGRYYSIDQLKQLAMDIPEVETITEYNTPPEPIWDISPTLRYLVFLLPFLLLTVEWAVRKRFRLL
ncbi:MAG TPA: vWA domain-containing protein [Pirellulaceae bacterium]|nr:vWA domain-containing protein [Pirellulaceae bacterium]